jgi:hypothetical protein
MKKTTKIVLISTTLILSGIASVFLLGKGRKEEDLGALPNPDADIPEETAINEIENTTGSTAIQVGDSLKPFGEYANVRSSMEVNNGWINNIVTTVYSPEIIGVVTSVSNAGNHVWYGVEWIEEVVMPSGNITELTKSGFVRADVVIKA